MRYTLLILLLYVCACSCRSSLQLADEQLPRADTIDGRPHMLYAPRWQRHKLGHAPDSLSRPYVQPIHGGKIEVATLAERPDSIITERGAFARRDIITYSNGKATYANVSRYTYLFGQHYDDLLGNHYGPSYSFDTATYAQKWPQHHPVFAKKLSDGNISIYGITFHHQFMNARGAKITNYPTNYYLRKGETDTVILFDYHTVKNIIHQGDKGWEYLQQFDQHKRMGFIGLAAGFAVFYSGGELGNSGYLSHQPVKTDIGISILSIGVSTFITSAVVLFRNHRNILKAIAAYNGVLK